MNSSEFFNFPEVSLPRHYGNNDFETYLSGIISGYSNAIQKMKPEDEVTQALQENISVINDASSSIINAVSNYLNGHPAKAFDSLKSSIETLGEYMTAMSLNDNITSEIPCLYRIRTDEDVICSREDIFHIPFQLRHKIHTQRYSIPGLPCLYLGGSLYICWEELSRPNFDIMQMARFSFSRDATVSILDFGYKPCDIASILDWKGQEETEHAIAYGMLWPLIAASSIQVRYADGTFKPEYIIPQLILQWITHNTDYDGIRFFSVNTNWLCRLGIPLSNFVFPVNTKAESGHCPHLAEMFEWTAPVSWNLMNAVHSTHIQGDYRHPMNKSNYEIRLTSEASVLYEHTDFYEMELKLSCLKSGSIL